MGSFQWSWTRQNFGTEITFRLIIRRTVLRFRQAFYNRIRSIVHEFTYSFGNFIDFRSACARWDLCSLKLAFTWTNFILSQGLEILLILNKLFKGSSPFLFDIPDRKTRFPSLSSIIPTIPSNFLPPIPIPTPKGDSSPKFLHIFSPQIMAFPQSLQSIHVWTPWRVSLTHIWLWHFLTVL